MNCEITIRENYLGPTILELEPVLEEITGSVEIRWEGTQQEIACLQRHPKKHFTLIVSDLSAMERAATLTGRRLQLDPQFVDNIKHTLISRKGYNWRFTVEDVGANVARAAVIKLSADSIRRGKRPLLARITADMFCEGISSQDTDVLLRLHAMKG